MKKIFIRFIIVAALVVPVVSTLPAMATAPNWDISGVWNLAFNSTMWPSGNPYLHDMTVAGSAATGGTPAGGTYINSWTASISISGDSLTINATYLPGSAVYPYSYTAEGTILPGGTASGTWSDTTGDSGTWTGNGPVVATDTTPPTTTVSCPVQAGPVSQFCLLSFSATDNSGGSGTAYTEYSENSGIAWVKYAGPIVFNGPIQKTILYRSADHAGNVEAAKSIVIDLTGALPSDFIKVHILKYLDGMKADAVSAGGYQFPMAATWRASNLNGGVSTSGNYVLGDNHGGAADQYGADTSPMLFPVDYTTSELTDSSSLVVSSPAACAPGKYLLNGYRTSPVDFATAATQALTAGAPIFTGLTSDRYVIVDNSKCPTGGTISGMKYNDLNRNGKKDLGEPGLSGWVIRLIFSGTLIATTTTGADGTYSFQNLIPRTYKLRETHQKGWKRMSKNPKDIVITAGSVVVDINFGNAAKKSAETEDNDNDDNRDDQPDKYYSNHEKSHYDAEDSSQRHEVGDGRN